MVYTPPFYYPLHIILWCISHRIKIKIKKIYEKRRICNLICNMIMFSFFRKHIICIYIISKKINRGKHLTEEKKLSHNMHASSDFTIFFFKKKVGNAKLIFTQKKSQTYLGLLLAYGWLSTYSYYTPIYLIYIGGVH